MNDERFNTVLAEHMHVIMRRQAITQKEIAKRTGITEISAGRYLRGERLVPLSFLAEFAQATGTTASAIVAAVEDTLRNT